MKKPFALFTVSCFLFFACGNEKPDSVSGSLSSVTVTKNDSVAADTLPQTAIALLTGGDTIEPADASQILYRFNEKLIGENSKTLSLKEVRKRFMPVDPECSSEPAMALQRLFYLDSMNRAGDRSYSDPGQIVQVDVRLIDTIPVSTEFTTVAWTIYYSTYEACPFSAGTYYMISTYDKNKKLISTQQMGMQSGGGDAPVSFNTVENGNLFKDASFKILHIDTTEDGDAPAQTRYEIYKQLFRGSIGKDGKIVREEIELKK